MRNLSSIRPNESAAENGRETQYDGTLVAGLTAAERNRVQPLLDAVSRRTADGKYTFTDRPSVDAWERDSRPTASSLGAEPGLERRYHDDIEAARSVLTARGKAAEFDAFLKESNARFLSRRRAETAEVKGDTVADILDWAAAGEEGAYIAEQVGKAAGWLKAKRLQEIAKQPFFKRMGSRLGRLRSFLGNDHPAEHIDVMASAVAALNKQGPHERVTGAQLLAALRSQYPDAFPVTGAGAVLPVLPEHN